MSTLAQGTPSDREFHQTVKSRADLVTELPQSEFVRADLSEALAVKVDSLRSQGIIDRVDTERRDSQARDRTSTYSIAVFVVDDRAREIAEAVVDSRDPICSCEHGGLRNRGEYFECSADFCDREFAREDLEVDV